MDDWEWIGSLHAMADIRSYATVDHSQLVDMTWQLRQKSLNIIANLYEDVFV
jgi:hypothetical protein